jgi:hypothetical protein
LRASEPFSLWGVLSGLTATEAWKETAMANWFHSAILATTLVATVAVGVASASLLLNGSQPAPKGDRLPVIADSSGYVTIETRGDGVSILKRVQVD